MCKNDIFVVEIMKNEEKVLLKITTCRKETKKIYLDSLFTKEEEKYFLVF